MSESEAVSRPETIDLVASEDPRDIVHRAVAFLARGEPILIDLVGVHGILSCAAAGLGHVGAAPMDLSSAMETACCLLLRGAEELGDWVPSPSRAAQRFAARGWPGPLRLEFSGIGPGGLLDRLPAPTLAALSRSGRVAFEMPSHSFVQDLIRLSPSPLILRASRGNDPRFIMAARTVVPIEIRENAPSDVEVPTRVGVDGEDWTLLEAGRHGEDAIREMASTIILFVCTGNTCRSPMAEAILRLRLAERLGCRASELEARGYSVRSAGVSAMNGIPAASHAVDVIESLGGSLRSHLSRKITRDLARSADLILTMTAEHRDALLHQAPEAASKTRLVDPRGHDVPDPYGGDREDYERTVAAIEGYVHEFLAEFAL